MANSINHRKMEAAARAARRRIEAIRFLSSISLDGSYPNASTTQEKPPQVSTLLPPDNIKGDAPGQSSKERSDAKAPASATATEATADALKNLSLQFPTTSARADIPSDRSSSKIIGMDLLKNGWFSENNEIWSGTSFSLEVEKVLHSEKSKYQDILVVQSRTMGQVLILDGIIQCSEKDEFSYQEMISFLPLCLHKNPEKVLIIGGGDGGVAREVDKHPLVKEILQVEIDKKVVEVSKKYLPFMAKGFESNKLTLHISDGFEFMKQQVNTFDVIITDSSDPVGPAVSLHEEPYFALMKKALRDGGIICSQGGTLWNKVDQIRTSMTYCKQHFPSTAFGYACVPTYPTGQIGFLLASLEPNVKFEEPVMTFDEDTLDAMQLRYYNADMHKAAFVLPRIFKKYLA